MSTTKERIKTVLICVLLLGMVYLTYAVWFFDSPFGEFNFSGILNAASGGFVSGGAGGDLDRFGIRPLAIAITQDGVTQGAVYDQNACDEIYKKLRPQIATVLRRGKDIRVSTEETFSAALLGDGVFFDYRGNVPYEALKLWLSETSGNETVCGRYFVFSTTGRTVTIHIKNPETNKVYRVETSVSSGSLSESLKDVPASSLSFAAKREEKEFLAATDEMLVSSNRISPALISSYNTLATFTADTTAACLEIFRFSGAAPSHYSEKDGTEVYVADMVTLRLLPEGIVSYTDNRESADETLGIEVVSDVEIPSLSEKCETARSLVALLASRISGSGGIYLSSVTTDGDEVEFVFGRHIGGVPVDMKNTVCFARVLVKEKSVGEARINLLGYEASGQTADVLPELLASAAVQDGKGKKDLNLRYKDTGAASIAPSWFIGGMQKKGAQ